MLYFELLREALSAVGVAFILTLIVYIVLSVLLWKQNKYNLKNIWFVLGSIVLVPFLFFELSIYLAASKVENRIVEPAQTYACSFAAKIDNYSTTVPSAINGFVGNIVSKKSGPIKTKAEEELASIINQVHDSLESVLNHKIAAVSDSTSSTSSIVCENVENIIDTLSDSLIDLTISKSSEGIDKAAEFMVTSANETIDKAMDMLPTNLVGELKSKFPALSIFLTDKGIDGDNSEEIVSSLFKKVTIAIRDFKQSVMTRIIKLALTFTIVSLLLGFWKGKRKSKKEKSQETTDPVISHQD